MQHTKGKGILEVFIVQTETVDFLAILVKLSDDRVLANGRVLFEDGSRWLLQSTEGERSAMREEIMTLAARPSRVNTKPMFFNFDSRERWLSLSSSNNCGRPSRTG